MTERHAFLRLYQFGWRAAGPLVPYWLSRRATKGKEDPARLSERRGIPSLARPHGKLVCMHGASVGEAFALLPLVAKIRERHHKILMTTGTLTSARLLSQRLPDGALHQFAPLDAPSFVESFFEFWRPDLLVLAESELWPNLLFAARERGIPVALVNARLSERTFRRWKRVPGMVRELLSAITLCLAQTPADATRFAALGAQNVETSGNLKFDATPLPARLTDLARLRASIGVRKCWIAASTHEDEEETILDVHKALSLRFPRVITIMAPRHPVRAEAIAAKASALGMPVARRSRAESLSPVTQIYLCDTIGELGLLYRLDVPVFLGKSLASSGGQNPIEPGQLGNAILHGPRVANFADIYADLDKAGGARAVANTAGLAGAVAELLTDDEARVALARRAIAVLRHHTGATERIMRSLAPYLEQSEKATA